MDERIARCTETETWKGKKKKKKKPAMKKKKFRDTTRRREGWQGNGGKPGKSKPENTL